MRSAVESATMTITLNRELRAYDVCFCYCEVKIEKNLVTSNLLVTNQLRNAARGFAVYSHKKVRVSGRVCSVCV